MKMLIMGAPGSGKGTQSEILVEKLGIPTISTGNMLRAAIAEGTETGKQAEAYINAGKLVPDQVIIGVVLDRLKKEDCQNGYILDGFPRTLAQAEAMDSAGIDIDTALLIDVPDEDILARLGGRRVCSDCGATYHVQFNPPKTEGVCDVDGGKLIIREDDTEETIKNRLTVYHEQTAPVVDYYRNKGKLVRVQAVNGVEATTALVLEALGK